jgi:hypothetical protein
MPTNKKSFPLRLDPDIYRAVEQWAGDEFRSVNAHIEYLLREALKKAGRLPPPKPRNPDAQNPPKGKRNRQSPPNGEAVESSDPPSG